MINSILEAILWVFTQLCQFLSNIILFPIYSALSLILPDLSSYTSIVGQFFNQYILNGLGFAKEVFLNVTGFPRELFNIMVIFFAAKVSYMATKRAIKFIINLYSTIKGNLPYQPISRWSKCKIERG